MRHYPKDDRKDVPLLEVEKDWEDLNHEDNEDDEGIPDGDLSSIKAGILEGCKMVGFFFFLSPAMRAREPRV